MLKIYTLLTVIILILIACTPTKKSTSLSVDPQCLKSQSKCAVETKFGKVNVLFNKDEILTEDPFTIYLILENKNLIKEDLVKSKEPNVKYKISKIESYMEGNEMFMGKIPVIFSSAREDNVMIAESLLGSCSEKQMVWRLWLTVFFEINNESATNNKYKEAYQETFFINFTSRRF
jgi:hypothetical protein